MESVNHGKLDDLKGCPHSEGVERRVGKGPGVWEESCLSDLFGDDQGQEAVFLNGEDGVHLVVGKRGDYRCRYLKWGM